MENVCYLLFFAYFSVAWLTALEGTYVQCLQNLNVLFLLYMLENVVIEAYKLIEYTNFTRLVLYCRNPHLSPVVSLALKAKEANMSK